MSGPNKKSQLVSALALLSTLQAGQTITVGKGGNITIAKHSTWGEMVGYKSTDRRKQALAYIKTLFSEALTFLRIDPSGDLINSFDPALKGITVLKETYKGDFYTIAEIDRIIESTRRELAQILQQLLTKPSEQIQPEVSDEICSEVIAELNSLANTVGPAETGQPEKFRARSDVERGVPSEITSTPDAMVTQSDRTGHSKPTEPEIPRIPLVGGGESGVCRPTDDPIRLVEETPIGDLIAAASSETVQIVLAASDEIKKQLDDLSKSQPDIDKSYENGTILDSRAEVIITDSRKIIKNSDSSKDTLTHVDRTSPVTDYAVTERVIANEHVIIYVGQTVLTSMDSDQESFSDCPSPCSCLDLSRRNGTRPDPARNNSSKCPAFSTQDFSSTEATNGSPAIIRLVQAFEQWLDSLDDDESD